MKRSVMTLALYVVIIIGLIASVLFKPINKTMNMREITVTVTDKAVKNDGKYSRYLIYTEDENGEINTLEITDSLFKMRFDSSDVYAQIQPGIKYTFVVGGSRIKILSCYPNIYEIKQIEC